MKKLYKLIILVLILCAANLELAYASRAVAPAEVPPVYYDNLRIEAGFINDKNIGTVTAYNIDTNKVIWTSNVYKEKFSDSVEADTLWVYIEKMEIVNNKLIIVNEKGNQYEIDPDNGKNYNQNYRAKIFTIIMFAFPVIIVVLLFYINRNKKIISKTLHDTALHYGVNGPSNKMY